MEAMASCAAPSAFRRQSSLISEHLKPAPSSLLRVSAQHTCYSSFIRHGRRLYSGSRSLLHHAHAPGPVRAGSIATDSKEVVTAVKEKSTFNHILHYYRKPFLSESAVAELLKRVQEKVAPHVHSLDTEQCFNVALSSDIGKEKLEVLEWLLKETFEPDLLQCQSLLEKRGPADNSFSYLVEVGPRLSFTTAWSANAVSICKACGLSEVIRIERSRRYVLSVKGDDPPLDLSQLELFSALVHDRMTECVYPSKLTSFETNVVPEPVFQVPVVEKGQEALEAINQKMGLAFDDFDLKYYTNLFQNDIKRNPTNVELFDIAQSNSEHSRHWFFKGELVIDGKIVASSLMDLVKDTLKANPNNSVIGFNDNSSAIRGFLVDVLRPKNPGSPSALLTFSRDLDILFTAETHNFPCAVAPFPGAETGAGGRIRDTHATGTGSLVVASTAGYCVGNLQLDGGIAPWEDSTFIYPNNLASPLQILIDASDGASDYGNKFGEPLIQGFTRTFGMKLPNAERREWLKPIMFSGGIGQIDHEHVKKGEPERSMLVVKIGGPAYRIGMGGGAASSMVSGQNDAQLDFNAVQRGDAEMAQKLYRVIRACVEMGKNNPIISIHDQGAGGNCNVVKEIIYPEGAEIDVRSVVVGDKTLSVLEIWGAEYQEQDALLIKPESEQLLRAVCDRERVSMAVIGSISGSGKITLVDSKAIAEAAANGLPAPNPAVDLDLEKVLGDMPRKRFEFTRQQPLCEPLDLAAGVTVMDALRRVLHLPSVSSKRFLTTKVDRCVTGLVAQQQTVGPLQLSLSDVAVIAQSYTGLTGGACAIGEQPIKGLLNPKAMARLAVGEALTNLVWAKVSALEDVKASGNWMYAAKLGGEGACMYDAAVALRDAMIDLKIAIDGGKDSLSMAAQAGGELVKAPGDLVISVYAPCPDITKTVTPDLKLGDKENHPHSRESLSKCLLDKKLISAGHDVCLEASEKVQLKGRPLFEVLFAEELGLLLEVDQHKQEEVIAELAAAGVSCAVIGHVTASPVIDISVSGHECIRASMPELRDVWEETSFMLERLQSNLE
ncbi:hypothetical protein GOP47_0024951 [Adiantum capillus-veneris]|uniref:phosphoribosylformylglycinamidine synthase n=1 Tax=Adiantum capillus-veneris TaxID=13818 RepID=A0A9D4U2R7_ADICA|nr:hypothetical protein GOP47_0024951 [Adiantum capillus-veneris]